MTLNMQEYADKLERRKKKMNNIKHYILVHVLY